MIIKSESDMQMCSSGNDYFLLNTDDDYGDDYDAAPLFSFHDLMMDDFCWQTGRSAQTILIFWCWSSSVNTSGTKSPQVMKNADDYDFRRIIIIMWYNKTVPLLFIE